MVKLAKLLFLIFSAASPKPFSLLNNNSSMDMEVNPDTNPVVLFKSNTLPNKTSSFSTKLNPLPIKPKLPMFKEPLSVIASSRQVLSRGVGPPFPLMEMDPTSVVILLTVTGFLILGLLVILVIVLLGACVNQRSLPIQCDANYSKKTSFEEI